MCTINMNSKELSDRVSKYPYTTGSVGASGCWNYTQLDKSYVQNVEDRSFFDKNQTTMTPKTYWTKDVLNDSKWTFDGTPRIYFGSIQPPIQYNPEFIKYDHIQQGVTADPAFSGDPSQIKFQKAPLIKE